MARAVGIVIPTWDGRDQLQACLTGLRRQTFTDFEIYVVDNGSTDGTRELLAKDFPEARLIRFHINHGFARAANAGLRAAANPLVALLNNDVIPEPQWLETLVQRANAFTQESQWASVLLWKDRPDYVESAGLALGRDGSPVLPWRDEPATALPQAPVSVFGAHGGAALFRWKMLEEIGLLDERFFCYVEDVDLALRARFAGYTCTLVPAARARHEHMGTAKRNPHRAAYYRYRNLVLCLVKQMSAGFLLRRLPRFVGTGVLRLLGTPWRGTGWALLAAKFGILRHLPYALDARHRLRATKRLSDAELEAQLVRGGKYPAVGGP